MPPDADTIPADHHLVQGFDGGAEIGERGIHLLRQQIKTGDLIDIGCGGDHRLSADPARQPGGQLIGTAEMAGEQTDHMLSFLIHHDHGRVTHFVLNHRCQYPHGNAGCADDNQSVILCKCLL
ncbi:Uncharacterised protein [Morganella morganii]|nr:Uncharacterised protein [Morganella morganii]